MSKKNGYITNDSLADLQKISQRSCNGYLILFDIKNSTKRKEEYKYHSKWVEQTTLFYKAFKNLNEDIVEENKKLKLESEKFMGDGVMAFFKDSESLSTSINEVTSSNISKNILEKVIRFKNEIEAQDYLGSMSLKTVVTYLTDIHLVKIGKELGDVLGRGIDFSYRLEEYADSSHIVINNFFEKSISVIKNKLIVNGKEYAAIQIKKSMKGWGDPQEFCVLTNRDGIKKMFKNNPPSVNEKSIDIELISFYLEDNANASNKANDII